MTKSLVIEELSGAPRLHGLFENVGTFQCGQTRLDIESFRFDSVRKLPFYVFNLINNDGAVVGQYQFAPGKPEAVGEVGHAGGSVDPAYRNRSHSQEAVKALGGLAKMHGMTSFLITCPKDNIAARKALDHVGVELKDRNENVCFYEIPVMPD
jgi:predicted acetyltransferase